MRHLSLPALAAAAMFLVVPAAFATPTTQISTIDVGPVSGSVATITMTQVSSTEIDLLVQLGMVNGHQTVWANTSNGNQHTPFTFNLTNALAGLAQVSVLSTISGIFAVLPGSQPNTPYGSYTNGISCPGCGNGTSGKNSTDLTIKVTNAGGIAFSDFVANSDGYYFAADLGVYNTSGKLKTGSFAADGITGGGGSSGEPPLDVPEAESVMLLGVALVGLAFVRRRSAAA